MGAGRVIVIDHLELDELTATDDRQRGNVSGLTVARTTFTSGCDDASSTRARATACP